MTFTVVKLSGDQKGFDWAVNKDGGIVVGFDGRPERFMSERAAQIWADRLEGEEFVAKADPLTKKVASRLQAVCSTPLYEPMLFRMADAAIRAVQEEGEAA